jgi:Kef-type K+ transport system membrane component KefB
MVGPPRGSPRVRPASFPAVPGERILVTSLLHSVEFQMTLLLSVALAGQLLASRANQSAVIGQIIAGLLVGPSVLGLVTYSDVVGTLATLGAIFLLFVVGMELRLEDIARGRFLAIALAGVFVPLGMGYGVAALFGFGFGAALFVGTALTATSIAITAKVLAEMGRLDTDTARAIIGAAVIDDVLGLLVLAVSTGIVGGTLSVLSVAAVLGKALLFLGGGIAAGRWGFRRLLVALDGSSLTRRAPEVTLLFAVMVAFLYAMAAEAIGLSAIVGAFIAGASLGGLPLKHGRDLRHGAEPLSAVFASVFFVSLGILVDVRALDGWLLAFLAALTAVAIVSKVVGCGGAALLTGSGLRDAAVIGFGMSPRGEVAMIIALIGLERGLVGQAAYVAVILVSLITTIATPLVLKALARGPITRAGDGPGQSQGLPT